MRMIRLWVFGLLVVSPSLAAVQSSSSIRDSAGLFSKEALRQAEAELQKVERSTRIPVVVETVESLRGEPIEEEAMKRARQLGSGGVYILMSKDDHKLSSILIRRQLADRLPEAKRGAIRDAIVEDFRKRAFDAGLLRGVQMITESLVSTAPSAPSAPAIAMAPAGESRLILKNQVRLTLAGARAALAGAEAKAADQGWKMNIAVVDEGGHLLAFARMDGARPASAATATTKAVSAATFRQATGPLPEGTTEPDVLLNISIQNAATAGGARVTTLLGGAPIIIEGQVIGALGVGGGSGAQDAEVAKAGVEAFLKELAAGAKSSERHP
jgi:uncharacterized protein GlcG (DUF336 family)